MTSPNLVFLRLSCSLCALVRSSCLPSSRQVLVLPRLRPQLKWEAQKTTTTTRRPPLAGCCAHSSRLRAWHDPTWWLSPGVFQHLNQPQRPAEVGKHTSCVHTAVVTCSPAYVCARAFARLAAGVAHRSRAVVCVAQSAALPAPCVVAAVSAASRETMRRRRERSGDRCACALAGGRQAGVRVYVSRVLSAPRSASLWTLPPRGIGIGIGRI